MTARELIEALKGAYPPQQQSEELLRGYWRVLGSAGLEPAALDRVYDVITRKCKYFPSIAEMDEVVAALRPVKPKMPEPAFQLFTARGKRWARPVKLEEPPEWPEVSTHRHLAVPNPVEYHACGLREGVEAALWGFQAAGGDVSSEHYHVLKAMLARTAPDLKAVLKAAREPDDPEIPF